MDACAADWTPDPVALPWAVRPGSGRRHFRVAYQDATLHVDYVVTMAPE